MKKEAILHMPLSQYAFACDEQHLAIRLRTAKGDCRECVLYFGDRAYPQQEVKMTKVVMDIAGSDMYYDYYETVIETEYTRVCYYFTVSDNNETLYYYERGLTGKLDCGRTEYFQFPFIRREDIFSIPSWAKDMVMYHIFPDSFASGKDELAKEGLKRQVVKSDGTLTNSETHLGGTLDGITSNVPYLKDLGINCIYLNPIFSANSYHKYDTIDYFDVDPCFGTKNDLKKLVATCHKAGIRVIFDGVFNHCGPDFFAFADVLKNGKASKYFDWFYDMPETVEYTDPPTYAAFAYVKEMPKLNTSNKELEEYLINVGTYWIREVGIDGWRLDVANEVNHDFWRHFRDAIRKVKPDAFMIGEIWEDAGVWLLGDQFDSSMNYRFSYLCIDFFGKQTMTVSEFDQAINRMIYRYPSKVSLVQMNLLDSHDVPRFLSFCNGNRDKMKLSFFYLFMAYGIPSMFYGDEFFIEGVEEKDYRQAMPWKSEDNAIKEFKEWIGLRNEHSALRSGAYRTKYIDDTNGIYAFSRVNNEEEVVAVLNNSETAYVVTKELETAVKGKLLAGETLPPYAYKCSCI